MPTLAKLGNLTIAMYGKPREHAPPHFHVIGPDVNFTIRLDTLQILAGQANRKAFATAVSWAEENIDVLKAFWSNLND